LHLATGVTPNKMKRAMKNLTATQITVVSNSKVSFSNRSDNLAGRQPLPNFLLDPPPVVH